MSDSISRRKWLARGLMAAGGVGGVAGATRLADRYGLIPPDSGGIWGPGETLTYACQKLLTSSHSKAREFNRSQISKVIPVSGRPSKKDPYQRLLAGGFTDWRLPFDGLVARPAAFSLADLYGYPARTQITQQTCEEGWSFIAEWKGVPLSYVMDLVGLQPSARYLVFYAFDESWDSIDLQDAWHPQTLLAYGMNGKELSPDHGAPVRLKVPRQLGYKSLKFLSKVTAVDSLKHVGNGNGSIQPEYGYSWFAGI